MNINIDISEDITLAFIAAIIGIAFPIIIQTVSDIDAKYGSTRLVRRIKRSRKFKFLYIMLGITVLTRFYYCIAPPRMADYGKWNYLIENSAIFLCIILTIVLIISLGIFLTEILCYYDPDRLLKSIYKEIKSYYTIARNATSDIEPTTSYQRQQESSIVTTFLDLNDLAIYIMNSKNENTVRQLFQSINNISSIFTKPLNINEVQFPPVFYDLIRSINQVQCQQKKQFRSVTNNNLTTFIFFNGILTGRISSASYACIWQCLGEQLYNQRQDLIFQYWTYAYQHYTFNLKRRLYEGEILNKGIKGYEHTVTAEDVKNRENDRARFRLFNIALCSHILYKKQYLLLRNILQYSNTTFPISESLVPGSYLEIIYMHIEVNRINRTMPLWFEKNFPFIDMQYGVYNDNIIKSWIDKILFILMLWAEVANQDRNNEYKLEMPGIPLTIADKQVLQRSITDLIKIADDITGEINIDQIYQGLSSKSDIVINKLKSFIDKIKQAQETQEVEQNPDSDLVEEFYTSAKNAVTEFKNLLNIICNGKAGVTSTNKVQIGFQYDKITGKNIYCKDQEYSRGNYTEVMSELIVYNLYHGLYKALSKNANATETCLRTDMIEILNRLQLDNKHIIIASSPDYDKWFDKIESKLKKETDIKYMYHKTPFFKLNLGITGTCIWILQSKELIGYTLGDAPFNSDFSTKMTKIDDAIFAKIIDLHGKTDIIEKLKSKPGEKLDYDKCVLELLDINIEVNFTEHPHILQVELVNQWSRSPYTIWQKVKTYNEYSA